MLTPNHGAGFDLKVLDLKALDLHPVEYLCNKTA
jgi:hypothetical protein